MNKTALIGAAGATGKSIAGALRARKEDYRVVGRDQERLRKTFGADGDCEVATWNPDEPASVRAACRGANTLIYLVGVPYDHFELHPALMRKTLDGAIAENVERIVLIGTVYPYGCPQTARVTEQHPREPHTFKGKMRKAQEDLLLEADAKGLIRGTILRLPDFYGPGVTASFLHSVFEAGVKGGTANVVGPIDVPHEFLFVPDAGPTVLELRDNLQAYGKWWNLAGPGTITQRQVAEQAFSITGRKPKLRVAGKTMLRLLGLFQPFMRELVEMHYLQTTPVLMDDTALANLLGGIRKTSYADGIRETMKAYAGPK